MSSEGPSLRVAFEASFPLLLAERDCSTSPVEMLFLCLSSSHHFTLALYFLIHKQFTFFSVLTEGENSF